MTTKFLLGSIEDIRSELPVAALSSLVNLSGKKIRGLFIMTRTSEGSLFREYTEID